MIYDIIEARLLFRLCARSFIPRAALSDSSNFVCYRLRCFCGALHWVLGGGVLRSILDVRDRVSCYHGVLILRPGITPYGLAGGEVFAQMKCKWIKP